MPLQHLIHECNKSGESATLELPDGKWCHSPAYFKRRYGVREPSPKRAPAKPITVTGLPDLDEHLARLTPAERSLLLAKLCDE